MSQLDSLTALLVLSALAGAVHVLAPDHWFPASTIAWRRGWRASTTLLFLVFAFGVHLSLGYGIFLLLGQSALSYLEPRLMGFTVALIGIAGLLRSFRFSQVEGVIRSSSLSHWRLWTVLMLLGPCESLLPILIKARQMGLEPAPVVFWFFAGTLAVGASLVLGSKRIWDQPELLARWVSVIRGRVAPIPVAGVVAGGLVYFLHLG